MSGPKFRTYREASERAKKLAHGAGVVVRVQKVDDQWQVRDPTARDENPPDALTENIWTSRCSNSDFEISTNGILLTSIRLYFSA